MRFSHFLPTTLHSLSLATLLTLTTSLALPDPNTAIFPRTVAPGTPVAAPTELRILPLGDSITFGYQSPNGNGYRLELYNDLSGDDVVMAGVIQSGSMIDNWNAGYSGKTIQYIAEQANASLVQSPNVVLLMAGTNDMNPNPDISQQGTDAQAAASRLASLVDQVFDQVPSTVVMLAKIPHVADATQESNTRAFNALVPSIVSDRADAGQHISLVDMSVIQADQLVDGVHPNAATYDQMGDIWYQALHALPQGWIAPPLGPDPDHALNRDGSNVQ